MSKHVGSCLCGEVRFEIVGDFEHFFLCHCGRCRKDTGSAHAANLFSSTAKVRWLSGQDRIKTFNVPSTRHEKSFCSQCGSAVPCVQMNGALLVVPAGSLDNRSKRDPTPISLSRAAQIGIDVWRTFRDLMNCPAEVSSWPGPHRGPVTVTPRRPWRLIRSDDAGRGPVGHPGRERLTGTTHGAPSRMSAAVRLRVCLAPEAIPDRAPRHADHARFRSGRTRKCRLR